MNFVSDENLKKLFLAKENKGLSFQQLGNAIGRNEVWVSALFHGQAVATKEEALKILNLLGIRDDHVIRAITMFPKRNNGTEAMQIASDPAIYRFFEIASEYGPAIKAIINEKFGDGIMSAVGLKIYVDKETPQGSDEQRVKITLDGKFLPYTKW